ncbi:MRN complex-interacting protein isoform X1 [Pimephales promelas]|uniref:MRN complex-interacting protein isoform X1 n=1 Tax=Pimephales promelas TaxID=90988 RepID=UPI001955C12F|nr:MRN complex-interacting protein isoform X1 [Pimephales promelas]KAG1935595.1 MRN complex-interacting protein [Pimephales promelas]
MVQEFHVLRCFSCQTFQVQQVKKSKRWVCKVCGEKQSLKKEFGRGAAVDCRRHVQKLNALRGRLEDTHTLGSQWEQEDEEDEDEGPDQENASQEVCHHVSRWSKYTPEAAEEEEEEEEEEQVYTHTQRFRSQGTRKRKKSSGPYGVCEEEQSWTRGSGFKRPDLRDRRISAGSDDLPASRPAVHSSTHTAPVAAPQRTETDSRWDRFLRAAPTHPDEEEEDEADPDTLMAFPTGSPADDQTSVWGIPADRPLSSKTSSHTHKPAGSAHTHTLCERANTPKLSYNPLFLTDEDFDDTF